MTPSRAAHPRVPRSPRGADHPDEFGQLVKSTILSDFWPGIQLYYPPVKYAPALGIYEDLDRRRASASPSTRTTVPRTPSSSTSRTAAGRRR